MYAATKTWTGAVDALWSHDGNWAGGAPAEGDDLVFPAGVAATTQNDLANVTIQSMLFRSSYTVNGDTIRLAGPMRMDSCCPTVTINAGIQLAGSLAISDSGSMTLAGPIDLNGFTLTFNPYNSHITGAIVGTGSIINNGGVWSGNSTATATMTVNGGQPAAIDGSMPSINVTLNASLNGKGTVGNLTVTPSGRLMPGYATCCTSTNGAAIFTAKDLNFQGGYPGMMPGMGGSAYWVDLGGSAAGTGYDQLKVTGNLVIGAGTSLTVNVDSSFVPTAGQTFTVIDNAGANAVNGTFANLPEGATLTVNNMQFRISYAGGDGNDVVLTTVSVPKTWLGAVSNTWSNPANWSGGAVPADGDLIVFPSGAARNVVNNDLPATNTYKSIVFRSDYTLNGNTIRLTNSMSMASCCPGVTVNAGIQLAGPLAISDSGSMTLAGPIDLNGFTLTFNPYNSHITGAIVGTGSIINNGGVWSGNSTATATMTVNGGQPAAIDGSMPSINVTLNASLNGKGTVGNLTVTPSGRLMPGYATCCTSTNGAAIFTAKDLNFQGGYPGMMPGMGGSAYWVDINTPRAGTGYDQIVANNITLGNGTTLTVFLDPSFIPTINGTYTIIRNTGSALVNGTFANLPDGAMLTLLGVYAFRINYNVGSGHDVVLTSLSGGAASSITLTATPNPATQYEPVTLTATVTGTGSVPTGTVTFRENGTAISAPIQLVNGVATFTSSSLSIGTHSFTAVYAGNATFGTSESDAVAETVQTNAATISTVTPNSGPTNGGTVVTIAGTNFQQGATIDFGGAPGTNVVVKSSTEIDVHTPMHASGTVTVTVLQPNSAAAALANAFTFADPNHPPVAQCRDITLTADKSCGATVNAADIDSGSFDPDADVLSFSVSPGTRLQVGVNTLTLTVTDSHGASGSCTSKATVVDKTAPTIAAPPNQSANNTPHQCGAAIDAGVATATDNCSAVTVAGVRSDNQPLNAVYQVGSTSITWTATDAAGNYATSVQTIYVADVEPPIVVAPANVIVPNTPGACGATVNVGTATANDNCGVASIIGVRADGLSLSAMYPTGVTAITWTAVDTSGNKSSAVETVTVNDTEPPTIDSASLSQTQLWPADHRMVDLTVGYDVHDNCDPSTAIATRLTITSNEATNATGDGNTSADWQIIDNHHIRLRAERSGNGADRIYTVTVTATDLKGNSSSRSVTCTVPHDH